MANRTGWQRIARRIRVPLGFVFAVVFVWLARPTGAALLASLALVLPGLWLRAYASGYVKKNAELTTSGPYAYTRNPLYLGSLMIAFGFGVASVSWALVVLLAVLFATIYIPTIQSEETYLRSHFPNFDVYVAKVPRLLPRLTAAQGMGQGGQFSRSLYLQHREYNALLGAVAIYVFLLLRLFWEHGR